MARYRHRYNKYGAQKVVIDGIKFDSHSESRRYQELKLLEKAGLIRDLVIHPKWELVPAFEHAEGREQKITYTADFQYYDVVQRLCIVEDVKGFNRRTQKFILTEVFKIKRKLLLRRYPEIIFRIVEA